MSSDAIEGKLVANDEVAAPAFPTRTFYWLVRRELWEHRALYLAPAGIAAFALVVQFLTVLITSDAERAALLASPTAARALAAPYNAVTGAVVVTGLLVGVLYSLDALYGERRDRSILFWKSLPVSDRLTVLAKAAVPLVILPVIVFVTAACASLLMLVLQTLVWSLDGFDPRALWTRLDLPELWLSLAYGLPFMALWYAPLYAWLLLASAWSRRWPLLWGGAPFAAALVVEHTALHQTSAHWMVERYLGGGVIQPYTRGGGGQVWIEGLSELEPARLYLMPALWIGVVLAAVFLAAAVRVRRSRGPV